MISYVYKLLYGFSFQLEPQQILSTIFFFFSLFYYNFEQLILYFIYMKINNRIIIK